MTTSPDFSLDRRAFLKLGVAAGSGLLLGCRVSDGDVPRASGTLNAWIHIGTDDVVTLSISESEMGQGIHTALSQVVADELEAEWTALRVQHAPADADRYGQQSTGGSTSVRQDYGSLREAGAAARAMLIEAAAAEWGVPVAECSAEAGEVHHRATSRRLRYGALAARAGRLKPPDDPPLKTASDFRYIGKAMPRVDTPAKTTGSAVFGIDVRLPGMVTAVVAHAPFGGAVARFDAAGARAVPGVVDVVEIPTGVAVVAEHFWAAKQGRDALDVTWDRGKWEGLSSASIHDHLAEICGDGIEVHRAGDVDAALSAGARRIDAVYTAPYLAHATMEPVNCTADVRPDRCEVWVSTQAPTSSQRVAAEIAGLRPNRVVVHTTFLGGGFGRRSQTDFVEDAVHLSKALGRPVQAVYSREEDMGAGWYRPVVYARCSGAVDRAGWPVAWRHQVASPSILSRFGPLRDGIDAAAVEGLDPLPYAVPNQHITWAQPDLPITTWFWRAVGNSQNAWMVECFLDELARAGGKDPLAVRRRLLRHQPRHLRVLEKAATEAGWNGTLPSGHALGIAVWASFGSYVAQVAEVSRRDDGRVRVHRVVCAIDCGQVVNPDTVTAQMESGIAFGLTAALYGRIDIENAAATQRNFNTYRMLRMREMPAVETHLIPSGDAHGGIGEVGLPPIAPAVCNAWLALTGQPVRSLPLIDA